MRYPQTMNASPKLLLIDTCGETAGIALFAGQNRVALEEFAPGQASAEIVSAIQRLLRQAEWKLAELEAVGVVSGPGSFTGVRTGMSVAKGVCEAAALKLVAVSRLAVLADVAALQTGLVALDAGRGELYVRDVATGREWLANAESSAVMLPLRVVDALPSVLRGLEQGGSDTALVEANYVRGEKDIYSKQVQP